MQTKFDKVLDGDTIVISGEAINVRGMDTPELGPWAKCWGEALAAGFSKAQLEEEITSRKYNVSEKRADASGNLSAKFTDEEGFDLIDSMTVYGGAAVTDGTGAAICPIREMKKIRHLAAPIYGGQVEMFMMREHRTKKLTDRTRPRCKHSPTSQRPLSSTFLPNRLVVDGTETVIHSLRKLSERTTGFENEGGRCERQKR